jgi:hypothetical protein
VPALPTLRVQFCRAIRLCWRPAGRPVTPLASSMPPVKRRQIRGFGEKLCFVRPLIGTFETSDGINSANSGGRHG